MRENHVAPRPSRIAWIDSLRVLFMFGVFLMHSVGGDVMATYARAATYGYLMLAGFFFVRPGESVSFFPCKKVLHLLVVYVFWVMMLSLICGLMAHAGELLTHVKDGHFPGCVSCFVPPWKDFIYPYVAPHIVHMWWFKSYLLVTCLGGVLHRMTAPFLLLLVLLLAGINDLNIFSEPVFLRPVALAFFALGLLLARAPRAGVEMITGKALSRAALLPCMLLPFAVLAVFFFRLVGYPPLHDHALFILSFIVLLSFCCHGIEQYAPLIRKCFSALAPSLMIFYVSHGIVIQTYGEVCRRIFEMPPSVWLMPVLCIATFILCFGVYRFITAYSPLLCYLCLCKPRKRKADA